MVSSRTTNHHGRQIGRLRIENKTIDPSHPLYIHHSDQPGHILQTVIHALIKKKIGSADGQLKNHRRKMNPLCLNSGINATA
ncbi:hypothetical protein AAG906_020464 [Vitis piasezkii]